MKGGWKEILKKAVFYLKWYTFSIPCVYYYACCLQHSIETYWVRSSIHQLTIFPLIMTSVGIVMLLLGLMFLKGVCKLRQSQSEIMDLQNTEPLTESELDQDPTSSKIIVLMLVKTNFYISSLPLMLVVVQVSNQLHIQEPD